MSAVNGTANQTFDEINIPNRVSPDSIGSLPDFDSLTSRAFNEMLCTFARNGNFVAIELMKSKRTVDIKVINQAIMIALRFNQLRTAEKSMRHDVSQEVRGWFIVYAAENNRIGYIENWLPSLSMIKPDFLESAQAKASEKGYWEILEYLTKESFSPPPQPFSVPPSNCCTIQ